MLRVYRSVEEAISIIAEKLDVDPSTFEEVPGLHVDVIGQGILDNPNTPEEMRQKIQDRIKTHRGFQFEHWGKTLQIIITPHSGGFSCWRFGSFGNPIHFDI